MTTPTDAKNRDGEELLGLEAPAFANEGDGSVSESDEEEDGPSSLGWEAPPAELADPLAPIEKWLPGENFLKAEEARLPPERTLRHPFRVRDQGEVAPCCVSMGIVVCMEILDARQDPMLELSPLYHYYAITQPHLAA